MLSSPLLFLIGLKPNPLKVHKEIIKFLLVLARKGVMVKWIGADSPSVQLWLIPVVILERLRYYINGRNHLFITKLKSTVEVFGIKCILDLACKLSRTCFLKLKFHTFIYFSLDFISIM